VGITSGKVLYVCVGTSGAQINEFRSCAAPHWMPTCYSIEWQGYVAWRCSTAENQTELPPKSAATGCFHTVSLNSSCMAAQVVTCIASHARPHQGALSSKTLIPILQRLYAGALIDTTVVTIIRPPHTIGSR